ncbi:MAG: hypothetical protein VX949_11320 [Planctomycetota bacterium]|nr:hypothetical protein [Planctomycetota bacterium]
MSDRNLHLLSLCIAVLLIPTPMLAQGTWYGDQDALWRQQDGVSQPLADLGNDLRSIARTAAGGGWIAIDGQSEVVHVDPAGVVLEVVDTDVGVQSLAIDSTGRVWGTRPALDDVIVIMAGEGIVASHGVGSVPYGITVDTLDRIWISCSYGNVVQILTSDGDLEQEHAVGFFPTGITASRDGGVWLAEKEGLRRISSGGVTIWSGVAGVFPIGVTTDLLGRAWFSCQSSHQVVVVGDEGVENIIDVPLRPLGISGNGDGTVAVLCRDGSVVVQLDPTGQIIEQELVETPIGSGDLSGLSRALVVDPSGDVDSDGVSNHAEAQLGFNPLDAASTPAVFIRGDANHDGVVDLSDGIESLLVIFGITSSSCLEALDVDDDGRLTLSDPIRIFDHVFGEGPAPGTPYPEYGPDPTPADGFPCTP